MIAMKAFDYIKTAFVNKYHLLALAAGVAFAAISPIPDVLFLVISAGEAAYLGLLATTPKYQTYVDAQVAKAARESAASSAEKTLGRILHALPRTSVERFESLRQQCRDLQQMSDDLGRADDTTPNYRIEGLDRLLWMYLRMLYTQYALSRFLNSTSDTQINADIKKTTAKLAQITADSPPRLKAALEGNLATCRDRLANIKKAKDNSDIVALEIDGLENKIKSLGEMALNRQEPEYISGQVDQVVTGMLDTEKTMSDLNFMTGLDSADEAPALMFHDKPTLKLVS